MSSSERILFLTPSTIKAGEPTYVSSPSPACVALDLRYIFQHSDPMQWLSVSEISKRTRIPAPTARRYASLFREYLPSRKVGRVTKYSDEAVIIFERISKLYSDGHVTTEIEEVLKRDYSRTIDMTPVSTACPEPALAAAPTILPSEMADTLNSVLQKFGSCLEIMSDQKAMIEAQREDIQRIKTAFVLLARSQKKLKALPGQSVEAAYSQFEAKTQQLEQKDIEIEEMTLGLSFDQSDIKAKMQILESELIRLRKDRRELEDFFKDKIERLKT